MFAAVKGDAARDFLMQPRHLVARDFRDARDLRVVRLRVGAAEAHEAVVHLARLRLGERDAEVLRDRCGDRAAADVQPAWENLARLAEEQVRRARSDVQQDGAAFRVRVIVAERIVERHRRDLHDRRLQAARLCGGVDLVEEVGLDRRQDHLHLPAVARIEKLPVPHHFINRVRDILLRLERHDLLDLRRIAHTRQRDRTRENDVRCDRVVHTAALHPEFAHDLLDLELCLRRPRRVSGRVAEDLALLQPGQREAPVCISLKLGQTDRLRAEVQREDSFGCGHSCR